MAERQRAAALREEAEVERERAASERELAKLAVERELQRSAEARVESDE
ncbi:hypothetical protein [Mycobacterium ahvazicum]|nr:hypothetical protein [Mycobacterium ahvazicum]